MIYEMLSKLNQILTERCDKSNINIKSMILLGLIIDNLEINELDEKFAELNLNDLTKNVLTRGSKHYSEDVKKFFTDCNLGRYCKVGKSFKFILNEETAELIENLFLSSEKLVSKCIPGDQISKDSIQVSNSRGTKKETKEKHTLKNVELSKPMFKDTAPKEELDPSDPGYADKRIGSHSFITDKQLKGNSESYKQARDEKEKLNTWDDEQEY